MSEKESGPTGESPGENVGRNEPCPCGSGRKYKRCHGVSAAPKLTPPRSAPAADAAAGGAGGIDFSQFDPQWMMQFTQALQRLPRGQMQRLQAIMQKAMAGKDVTAEAKAFEGSLPVEIQELIRQAKLPGMPGAGMPDLAALESAASSAGAGGASEQGMPETLEDARAIIERAVSEGKLSREQADELLKSSAQPSDPGTPPEQTAQEQGASGLGKLWRGLTGK
jgi:hypothetical protein